LTVQRLGRVTVPETPSLAAAQESPVSIAAAAEGELVAVESGARRALNVAVAAVLVVVTLPLMVVIAILIKLTSSGPILYRQTRIGLDTRTPGSRSLRNGRSRACDLGGQPFVIFKFRTMRVGAERGSGAVWAKQNDPRVIWIGGILRQARLDELPQLFNVLKGDMNVVGPRPERPSIFARLCDQVENYRFRQRVRPGITGLAQINQQYDRDLDDVRRKLDFDLQYIREQSAWNDLKIMLKTVPIVLFRKGGW
jgi:lipopolysaccharide/colanic/teichoic acid biosynthesis glycosyltransferase